VLDITPVQERYGTSPLDKKKEHQEFLDNQCIALQERYFDNRETGHEHDVHIVCDASVPKLPLQAVSGWFIHQGGTKLERDWVTAGLATSDDAELTAVSMDIISAAEKLGEDFNLASNIHIYSNSISALNRATDCSAHSGQTWSVTLMEVIGL